MDAGKGRIIGVVSAKGGVGKTTTVANLGITLARDFKRKVLAIDGNITTANLGLHLGLLYPPVTLHDVLKNNASVLQATYVHKDGLHVIPSSLTVDEKVNSNFLNKKIGELTNRYDVILVDSVPGLGREVVNVMKASDEILIVTTPQLPSVTTALKMVEFAKRIKVPILGVALNRVTKKDYELSEKEVSDTLEVPIVAVIPEDEKVPESIGAKDPVVIYDPKSRVSAAFRRLGAYLVGEEPPVLSFWGKLRRFLGFERGPPLTPAKEKVLEQKVQRLLDIERSLEEELSQLKKVKKSVAKRKKRGRKRREKKRIKGAKKVSAPKSKAQS